MEEISRDPPLAYRHQKGGLRGGRLDKGGVHVTNGLTPLSRMRDIGENYGNKKVTRGNGVAPK